MNLLPGKNIIIVTSVDNVSIGVISHDPAAEWDVKAFRMCKEAETAIGNTVWESASDAQKNATAVYNAMVEYVRNALTESRESQKKLADRAGVSQGSVTNFLSGGHSVGTNLTLALLEASGIDTFDMFYTYIDKKEEEGK